jgi:hypothetical protein
MILFFTFLIGMFAGLRSLTFYFTVKYRGYRDISRPPSAIKYPSEGTHSFLITCFN